MVHIMAEMGGNESKYVHIYPFLLFFLLVCFFFFFFLLQTPKSGRPPDGRVTGAMQELE